VIQRNTGTATNATVEHCAKAGTNHDRTGEHMHYFVTGATGFIGKRMVRKLLAFNDNTVHFLVREDSRGKLPALLEFWGANAQRALPVFGDLRSAQLGLSTDIIAALHNRIDHFFHFAALYDLSADPEAQIAVNVEGTRNTIALAEAIQAKCLHHVSSIAAAGMFEGIFREDMFEEAEHLEHPYFATKHEAEKIVREDCKVPWRVYRPGLVVGDSRSGEMDKVDGPYYFFKTLQRLRQLLPPWMPAIGLEGGRINIVPVDYVVDAMHHIAHLAAQDRRCFHLTDPAPMRVGDVLNTFAQAAHGPAMSLRINAGLLDLIPDSVKARMMALPPLLRIKETLMQNLGLPDNIMQFVNYPTRFDNRRAQALLAGSGIVCPRLEHYADRIWDYWERHLDPDLFIDHTLRGQVAGKVVLVTGGSSGIGLASAHKLAEAGAITIICGRDEAKLAAAKKAINDQGHDVVTYAVDLSDMQDCDRFIALILDQQGGVDILVNCAGRSIRRSLEASFERFHDFERTMRLNYFGALRVTMGLLPSMIARKSGHVIHVSSIGVLTSAPRFSAYVASKAAFDAWMLCAASELVDVNIGFTIINMPLVHTPMIAPTAIYRSVPTLTPQQAADKVVDAIVHRPVRIATRTGIFGEVLQATMPRVAQILMNAAFRSFPNSSTDAAAAPGEHAAAPMSTEQLLMRQLLQGLHL
jgi:NAD(P)-dependent dehydrogenase (short-subunit alcohol dehydrogenase family)